MIIEYSIICIILFMVMLFYLKIATRLKITDKPNLRSSHTQVTPNGGGIIFFIGVLLYFLWFGFGYLFFFIGLSLITAISFADDIRSVSKSLRLFFHCLAVVFLFVQLKMYDVSWYTFLFFLIVYVGFINIYNFMDGINGLTGGYSLVTVACFWYINNNIKLFIDNNLLYVLALSIVVFLFFNFRKKAICFAGDVGAVSMAFILLFLHIHLILKTADFSYFILFVVYGVDAGLTIIHRLLLKENILEAHRKHAYQIMVNELKIAHIKVASFYSLLQLLIFIGYIHMREYKYWYLVSIIFLLTGMYILFIRRYYNRFVEHAVKNR